LLLNYFEDKPRSHLWSFAESAIKTQELRLRIARKAPIKLRSYASISRNTRQQNSGVAPPNQAKSANKTQELRLICSARDREIRQPTSAKPPRA